MFGSECVPPNMVRDAEFNSCLVQDYCIVGRQGRILPFSDLVLWRRLPLCQVKCFKKNEVVQASVLENIIIYRRKDQIYVASCQITPFCLLSYFCFSLFLHFVYTGCKAGLFRDWDSVEAHTVLSLSLT